MGSHQDKHNQLEKLKKELTCNICIGIYYDPHALSCGHTFCGVCIKEWLGTKKVCPTCRVTVMRQPIRIIALQEMSELIQPQAATATRLTRASWVSLFPIEDNVNFIRDEDQDGIIHRCSQCGWELNENNYCVNCDLQYDGNLTGDAPNISSDNESHLDQSEGNLEHFVVEDDEVEYEDNLSGIDLIDEDDSDISNGSTDYRFRNTMNAIEISDEEDTPAIRNNRKRRIAIESDEDSDMEHSVPVQISSDSDTSGDSDEDMGISARYNMYNSTEGLNNTPQDYDTDDYNANWSEQEDYPEDVFDRRPRNKYIDDYADESDDDEETGMQRQPVRPDIITENINRAKNKMKETIRQPSTPIEDTDDSSDETDISDSDEPDYESMGRPLLKNKTIPSSSSSSKLPSSLKGKGKAPTSVSNNQAESSTKAEELKKKNKQKGNRKKKRSKRDKKKHKAN